MSGTLVIGYGNPGRIDDGLGPAFAEAVGRMNLPDVTVDADYQLTVEDAAAAAEHDVVLFADAAVKGREPFFLKEIAPSDTVSFSTHSVEPESVLALAKTMFHAPIRGYALGIRGYAFNEFGEYITGPALKNLEAALTYMEPVLRGGQWADALVDE